MKRFLKIFAVATIAVAAMIACIFAGCNKGGGETKSDYNFTVVYEDGSPVNGQTDGSYNGTKVFMQICLPGQNCYPLTDVELGANGKINLSQEQVNEILHSSTDVTVFEFHVIEVTGHNENCSVLTENGKGDYTLTVTVD